MVVACNDGYYRRFMPYQNVNSHAKVNQSKPTKAYCEECKQEFRSIETRLQIDDWRNHVCNTHRLRRVQND